ncbi:MAG: hypothetical protein R8J94_03840 [Acidimicrobiia bacterium]|nr:hypothetical protein [Acidimicrobiia bacterium]
MGGFDLVIFSSGSAAADLWAFGEDDLAERMLAFCDERMLDLWRTAARFYDEEHPLPVTGRKISLGHVVAFSCMLHVEGQLRPLSRQRRRPRSSLPSRFEEAKAKKQTELSALHLRLTHSE